MSIEDQDNALLNTSNPLALRSVFNGGDKLTFEEADGNLRNLMRWAGPWSADRTPYMKNEVVSDNGWLMIANKDTSDTAAPQNIGDPTYDLPEIPAFAELSQAAVVRTGHIYTTTEPGFVRAVQVWVPDVGADITYRILLLDLRDPANPIANSINSPTLIPDAWNNVAVGSSPYATGSQFAVVVDALNSGSATIVTGGWNRAANSNKDAPAAQSWNTNNANTVVRIDKTDLDSTDRTTELLGMVTGTVMRFADTVDPSLSMGWVVNANPTDAGSHILFSSVSYDGPGAGGVPPVGNATTMTADVPVASPTTYVELANNWPAGDPTWATVEGVKEYDGVDQGATLNAYGVRILFQEAYVSPDWDILTAGESGGTTSGISIGSINQSGPESVLVSEFQLGVYIHDDTGTLNAGRFRGDVASPVATSSLTLRGSVGQPVDLLSTLGDGDYIQARHGDAKATFVIEGPPVWLDDDELSVPVDLIEGQNLPTSWGDYERWVFTLGER